MVIDGVLFDFPRHAVFSGGEYLFDSWLFKFARGFRFERVEQPLQIQYCIFREFDVPAEFELFVGNGAVVPEGLLDLEFVVVAEVPQNHPASLLLHLLNQHLLQALEGLEDNPFHCLVFIVLLAFVNQHFLQSRDVLLLKLGLENVVLKFTQLVVVQITILILVTDPKYPQESALIFGLQCLRIRIEKRRYRKQNCLLRTIYYIYQIYISFCWTFNSHLNLFKLHEEGSQEWFEIIVVMRGP